MNKWYLTLYLLAHLFFISWICSAISVELYYIFATAWGREHYTLYGILLCVFAILLSVGACISVALTYFLLSGEDYRWWWRSVLSTGSTGIFIFVYSVFYYHNRSNMSGLVQSVEFFGYSLLTAFVFSLMLGTVSFWASLAFIRYIYRSLKMDWGETVWPPPSSNGERDSWTVSLWNPAWAGFVLLKYIKLSNVSDANLKRNREQTKQPTKD